MFVSANYGGELLPYINKIMFWNFWGVRSKNTLLHLGDMVRMYRLEVVALLETRVNSWTIEKWLGNFGLNKLVAVKAVVFAGGIWLIWDGTKIELAVLASNEQFMMVLASPIR